MNITPVSRALGAKVSEVNLSAKLSNSQANKLYAAFLKYRVLFFCGQNLSPQKFLRGKILLTKKQHSVF